MLNRAQTAMLILFLLLLAACGGAEIAFEETDASGVYTSPSFPEVSEMVNIQLYTTMEGLESVAAETIIDYERQSSFIVSEDGDGSASLLIFQSEGAPLSPTPEIGCIIGIGTSGGMPEVGPDSEVIPFNLEAGVDLEQQKNTFVSQFAPQYRLLASAAFTHTVANCRIDGGDTCADCSFCPGITGGTGCKE